MFIAILLLTIALEAFAQSDSSQNKPDPIDVRYHQYLNVRSH